MHNGNIFHLHPLVPIAVCLMAGIVLGHDYVLDVLPLLIMLLVLCLFVLLSFKCRYLCTILLLSATMMIGAALITLYERSIEIDLPDSYGEYEAVVVDEPVDKGRYVRLDLQITSGAYRGKTIRTSLQKDTIQERYKDICVGDGLRIYTLLRQARNFGQSNFDYVTFLKGRGIVAVSFVPYDCWQEANINLTGLSALDRTRLAAMKFRHRLLERFKSLGLSGGDFAVVSAMTLGDKSAVSEEIRNAYSVTGTSHILALSGMHLGIIYSLLSVLSLGKRFRMLRELLLITAVWAYTFMVGMSPSVIRAAVMLSVYAFIGLTGRRRMSLNALAFAAILMLVYNPLCLYDISFQLSFLAVAFILVYNERFSSLVSYEFQQAHPVFKFVWQMVCMSTVAQLGTSPLVVYYFGRLPVYFLLANVIVIPAATVILYSSVLMLALSVCPYLQVLVAKILAVVVSLLNALLIGLSRLRGASIDEIHVNVFQVILLYVVIVVLLFLLKRRRKVMIMA